ncbi:hypothetical protein HMPREF9621_00983 [Cutibacterium modestum HL037PA2]|uniref:Uncharacterized protein n=1 Tax=Cutibacterium modestum HL044PA1 TaxID=765109 RepID=A0ABP2KEI8_9ACTN|nr:hypothetical protein HMPREF9621_00983 [Cutibacterium modestum HL037PA2]EFS93249.1 hypothetical protein HMPREF9607_00461 [Cutibacterium modestum HL044PA1]
MVPGVISHPDNDEKLARNKPVAVTVGGGRYGGDIHRRRNGDNADRRPRIG